MPSPLAKTATAATGGLLAAVGSALCCVGPLVAVLLGVSGAGLAATFEPLRPYFVLATLLSLGAAHVIVRREQQQRACEPGSRCASPRARRWMMWSVWTGTVLAIPLLTFPWWSRFLAAI